MCKIEDYKYAQWQDRKLCDFLDICPCRVHFFLYPDIEYFKKRMNDKFYMFLKRTAISTDKDGLLKIDNCEWSRLLGKNLSKDIFCKCIGDLGFNVTNGIIKPLDQKSPYINCENGYRVTLGNKKENMRRVLVYGACNVFGLFCDDAGTICSYLQREFNKHDVDYNVINCGVWGSENIVSSLFSEFIDVNDEVIVILTNYHGDKSVLDKENVFIHNLASALDEISDLEECLINNIAHFNKKVNYSIAMHIYRETRKVYRVSNKRACSSPMWPKNYFISWNIYSYYVQEFSKYSFDFSNYDSIGCVVMNCNPVTLGHQYLVEYASKKVELLIVFIVEEDISEFKFVDRIKFAQCAFSKFKNVKVISSGKYAISLFTFPDYFERKQIKENYDVQYDLRIFSEVIAPMLNIKKRFVGDEPYSLVTRAYNVAMKRILPEYGIDVEEINRFKIQGNIVSASLIRRLLSENKINEALHYVPEEIKKSVLAVIDEKQW